MGFMKDFKAFAMKGSVIDLAVGVVIGAAFGKIVAAMVDDIIMPLVAMLTPKGQLFTDLFRELPFTLEPNKYKTLDEAKKAGVNVFAYGHFIQTIVDFIIIAFFIFLVIKAMARMRRKEIEAEQAAAAAAAAAPQPPTKSETLLTEIRDLLKK
ncbi:MAG: mscL [Flavipsychrobacter sp.]|jgi:large conductance mechanosensitive channel|nr:mscL [Flavipsychrobacter sp.]